MAFPLEESSLFPDRDLESAHDIYKGIVEFKTDSLYNKPAPHWMFSFGIGIFCTAIGWAYFFIRFHKIIAYLKKRKATITNSLMLRAAISSFTDADDAGYIIVKTTAQSFLFLGGLQLNYQVTFSVMLGYFAFEACFDSLRVLLSVNEVDRLSDLITTGKEMRSKLRNATADLSPSSVYEDLTRRPSIVTMVFITQVILISFVVSSCAGVDKKRSTVV